jgi:hypothetical protein
LNDNIDIDGRGRAAIGRVLALCVSIHEALDRLEAENRRLREDLDALRAAEVRA